MKVVLEVNNGEVEHALNGDNIQVQLNWDDKNPDNGLSVSLTNYRLGRDSAKIGNEHVAGGLTNGVGILEGVPLRLKLVDVDDELVLTDGFLNLASGGTKFKCDVIKLKIIHGK